MEAQEIKTVNDFEKELDSFLQSYNSDGLLNYGLIKKNKKDLTRLLSFLESSDISKSNDSTKALLINAYNLFVIANVVEAYPIASPLDKKDFFTRKSARIGGQILSLDELEKGLIFKKFPDYRLHFALVCAAIGCPKLPKKAFRGSQLESQLENATQSSIRSNELVRFSESQNMLSLSELFSWYLKDFGGTEKALLTLIQKYSSAKIPDNVKIDFTKYNWALNTN